MTKLLPKFEPRQVKLKDNKEITIRSFDKGDVKKCLLLRKEVYGAAFSRKEWEWKFGENCPFYSDVLLAEEAGKVVGIQPMIVFPFVVDGKEKTSLMLLDLMVTPSWQAKGIFSAFIDILQHEALKSVNFIYTFPNKRSLPGFINKFGWEIPFQPLLLSKVGRLRVLQDITAAPESSYIGLKKDNAYLDWRYSRPGMSYARIEKKTVLAWQKRFGIRCGLLAEFDFAAYEKRIVDVKGLAGTAPLIFLINSKSRASEILKNYRFAKTLNLLRQFNLVVKVNPADTYLLKNLSQWQLSFGDVDVI